MGDGMKLLINALAVCAIGLAAVRVLFLTPVIIQDNGMAPTLVYGEEVWVWKGASTDMANVMACEHPSRPGQLVIGRAVAFAGHTVSTDHHGTLYVDKGRTVSGVDGSVLFYDRTRKRQFDMILGAMDYFGRHDHQTFLEKGRSFQLATFAVNRGVYLLGDNRSESSFDSRAFGEVDPSRCLGQVAMRVRPTAESAAALGHRRFQLID
jgi:signal peptidase I